MDVSHSGNFTKDWHRDSHHKHPSWNRRLWRKAIIARLKNATRNEQVNLNSLGRLNGAQERLLKKHRQEYDGKVKREDWMKLQGLTEHQKRCIHRGAEGREKFNSRKQYLRVWFAELENRKEESNELMDKIMGTVNDNIGALLYVDDSTNGGAIASGKNATKLSIKKNLSNTQQRRLRHQAVASIAMLHQQSDRNELQFPFFLEAQQYMSSFYYLYEYAQIHFFYYIYVKYICWEIDWRFVATCY